MLLSTAVLCLAANVYYESRGEPTEGQLAVALVTMNRAHLDERNVCKVVLKPKQFSWTISAVNNGKIKKSYEPKDAKAWANSMMVAFITLNGMMPDITKGSDHYHASYVHPKWRHAMVATRVIGNHFFYKST
jgi:N-acetylmuramoyl-L-alanine amidase